ncbi:MAG TPA: GNAT family N-acetyltransferase, partial [Pirellulales bacterium]|nr:GNAT family N-acetyltransferase [Pirellulales bacterium]
MAHAVQFAPRQTSFQPGPSPRFALATLQKSSTVRNVDACESRTLEDPAELEELVPAWQSLAEAYTPMEQPVWGTSCLATLDAHRPLRVVSLNRGAECVGLASLVLRRVRGIRRLTLGGVNDLHEPADFLAADEAALRELTAEVVGRRQPVAIERMPADSPTLAALEQACRGRAIMVRRQTANCPHITLDQSWLEPETHLNSGRRSDLRRARRKAEQAGPVRFEILSPELADVDRLLDEAVAVEAKSWKGTARTALAHDARRAEFFRHYVRQVAQEGILRICFMYIGEAAVAMQIAIEGQGGFWLLKIGYDASFASASPGMLLMRETIRHAAAAGLAT